ncbi:MAG: aldolase [Sphingomonas sp.]|nr:aldolase [Sphingomonas sp.]
MTRLSTELRHATCVGRGGRALLLSGPSGSGKSDLALRLMDDDFELVSDDQVILSVKDEQLIAAPPPSIAGKMEVRGLGIIEVAHRPDMPVALFVDLSETPLRMPDENDCETILGISLPRIALVASDASAAAKAKLALDRIGLQF